METDRMGVKDGLELKLTFNGNVLDSALVLFLSDDGLHVEMGLVFFSSESLFVFYLLFFLSFSPSVDLLDLGLVLVSFPVVFIHSILKKICMSDNARGRHVEIHRPFSTSLSATKPRSELR